MSAFESKYLGTLVVLGDTWGGGGGGGAGRRLSPHDGDVLAKRP